MTIRYECPNGHVFESAVTVHCSECDASVACVPLARLIEQGAAIERLREALERIRRDEGKVCAGFEVCDHRACQSSYTAWAIADEATGGIERLSPIEHWTMIRRRDLEHDHGSLVAHDAPVPEPDAELEVFEVVPLNAVRDVIRDAAARFAGTGNPGDVLIAQAMFQSLTVIDIARNAS